VARKKKKRKHRSQQQATAPAVSSAPATGDVVPSRPAPVSVDAAPVGESTAAAAPPDAPPEGSAEPGANGPPRPTALDEAAPAIEDLDADLDLDDVGGSYDSLVAAVAGLEDDPPHRPSARNGRPPGTEVEVEEVHDLDDEDTAATVDRLIAQVGRGRPAVPPS
jgi:hypothetical protein